MDAIRLHRQSVTVALRWLMVLVVAMLALAAPGCTTPGPADGDNGNTNGNTNTNANDNGNDNTSGDGAAQPSLLYLLQVGDIAIDDITAHSFTWIVIEPTRTGTWADALSAAEVQQLRTAGACANRVVLAYLSIGEAEDYRDYWDTAWVDGDEGPPIPGVAPAWLGPSNPNWPGNYKVRYWDPDWQAVILGTPGGPDETPLDRIIDAGFDGVYLDIVDAFEFWSEPGGGEELTRAEARERMIAWVQTIADYAHDARGATDFLVFPQNGSEIIRNDDDVLDALSEDFFAAIDGIGIEDLFYDETTPQPAADVADRLLRLGEYRSRGKTVLVTDYVLDTEVDVAISGSRAADFYARTRAEGFVPYAALEDRNLDEVIVLSAPPWAIDQPSPCVAAPN